MNKKTRDRIKKVSKRLVIVLAFLICLQYILTGVHIGKSTIGEATSEKLLSSVFAASTDEDNSNSEEDSNEGQYLRLSNTLTQNSIPYRSESNVGWGILRVNEVDDNHTKISIKVEGANYQFDYGIFAHAHSNVYYDVSEYSQKYHTLTAYVGLNTTSNAGDGVQFNIYTSDKDTFHPEGSQNWTTQKVIDMTPGKNAEFISIDITGAKYLRLQAHHKNGNGQDHSVYVDPMLITDEYRQESEFKDVEYYDEQIKNYPNKNLEDEGYELLLLQRQFVKGAGKYALTRFASESAQNKQTLNWLFNNVENLRLYILGGTPDGGSYYNSLKELSKLYNEYSQDFDTADPDYSTVNGGKNNTKLGNTWDPDMTYADLYKKMAISLSLTHSQRVGLWMQSGSVENQSDSCRRYAIFKYLHENGKFKVKDNLDYTLWFEALQVEEMRFIMNNAIDDEEILWLNAYVQTKIDENNGNTGWLTPHPHMAYVWPSYGREEYYADENIAYFNELFSVKKEKTDESKTGLFDLEYTIPGGKNNPNYTIRVTRGTPSYKLYKLWMNFRNKFGTGAVCGGISKSGSNIRATHAIPATVIGQPGHAALLYYTKDAEGKGYWNIDNDVSGWTLSEKGERLLLGWGNANTNYARGSYQVVYMALAQEAINDYENLEKCEKLVMLANSYVDDPVKQEAIYRKALEIQPINVDAWLGLINLYNQSTTKTQDEYFALAEEVGEKLRYFPLPMQQLTNLIKPKLTTMGNEEQNMQNDYKFTLLQTRILTEGTLTPNNTADSYTVYQPSLTRVEANFLLGKLDKTIATFSFDGADAGKIVLADRFTGNGVRWEYCINGQTRNESNANSRGNGWIEISSPAEEGQHKLQLTPQQIESLTAENDIYIHIVGVNYDEKNLYKIDITEQSNLANLYNNDLENRMVGINLNTQWRYNESDEWTSYSIASPDLTGDKQVQVRQAPTGTKLASPASEFYTFTEDNQPNTRKYIPVSHLSIHAVSTQATNNGGAATNAIDANYNTRYHSAWNGTDTQRYITIKLDNPVYLSAVEFVPAGGGNGRIVDGTILGSMSGDDDDWEVLTSRTGITYPTQANTNEQAKQYTQNFGIDEPKEVQYVKIVADRTNGNWFAARAFNLFQDLTKKPVSTVPTAQITYSTTGATKDPVIARLVNPSTAITITNNGGKDTYVFTENGNFTFEFEDANGNKGSSIATVTWIDKDEPTVDVNYGLDADRKLLILLDNLSEDVYLLDENNNKINYIEIDENKKVTNITYLDESGNAYKILDKDENGKTTKITYKNTTGTVSNVATYVTTLKTVEDGNEEIKIGDVINEEYFDNEGNPVTVTEAEKEELRKLQQTARSNPLEYVIEQNGDYEFKMLDKANNLLYKSVKVDYIDNDNKILVNDITYNTTNKTKDDVIATIKPTVFNSKGEKTDAMVISEGGKTHTFTKENEQFVFKYKDPDDTQDLEVKEHTAKVDWIDKTAPTAQLEYSSKADTSKAIVTLVNESETITITNNGGLREYTFTENGEFTFEFQDEAGNKGKLTATVDWLENGFIFKSDIYKIQSGYVSKIAHNTTVSKFKENVTVKPEQELTILDKDGNALSDDDIITTSSTVKVGEKTYTLCVTGDTDADGEVTAADLADTIKAYLGELNLNSQQLKAIDVDEDGEITAADLADVVKLSLE